MRHWLRSYALMLKWQVLSAKQVLPLSIVVQVMIAVGFVIGLSFFYPEINPQTAKYLATGTPTLILLMSGLVMVPQLVAMARTEGTFDYIWSLPVPRLAFVAADATVWTLVPLPGVILSLVIAASYHGFSLVINPLVIPGLLLVALTGLFIGYTIAHGAPKPQMAHLLTQIIVFAMMLFSPVMFPSEQLPQGLASVHQVLPLKYMADISRGTLTDLNVNLGLAFSVVGVWCAAGLGATYLLVRRRH